MGYGLKCSKVLASLACISNRALEGDIPAEWSEIGTKEGKPPTDPKNYRPIGLTCVCFRLVDRVLVERIEEAGVLTLSTAQYAYTKDTGVEEALLSLHGAILGRANKTAWRRKDQCWAPGVVAVLKIDFKDAFCAMSHAEVLRSMLEAGVPKPYITFWHQVGQRKTFRVRVGDYISEPYSAPSGVNQGDCSAPLKWAFYVDSLLRELQELKVGWQSMLCPEPEYISEWPVGMADDIFVVVSATSEDGRTALKSITKRLQQVADCITNWCASRRLRLSPKTRVDMFSKRNFVARGGVLEMPTVEVAGEKVQATADAEDVPRYLVVLFSHNMGFDLHVNTVARKMGEAAAAIRATTLNPLAKRQLAHGLAVSQLRYCAAVWGPQTVQKVTQLEKLETALVQVARGVTGCHEATHREEVRLEANLPSVQQLVDDACARAVGPRRGVWSGSCHSALQKRLLCRMSSSWGIPRGVVLEPTGKALVADLAVPKSAVTLPDVVLRCPGQTLRKGLSTTPQLAQASAEIVTRGLEMARDATLPTTVYATDGGVVDGRSRAVATMWRGDPAAAGGILNDVHGAGSLVDVIAAADCGSFACSYRAEAIALELLLQHLLGETPRSSVVIMDALSVLSTLARGPSRARGRTARLWRLIRLILELGHRLTFAFVHSHVHLAANEAADQRVCDAMKEEVSITFPCWAVDVARSLQSIKDAAITERRKVAAVGTCSGEGPLSDRLLAKVPPNMRCFFHQVRTGRVTLVGRRHGGNDPRECPNCGVEETVDHWIHCSVNPPQRLAAFFDVELSSIKVCFEAWKHRAEQWRDNPCRWSAILVWVCLFYFIFIFIFFLTQRNAFYAHQP